MRTRELIERITSKARGKTQDSHEILLAIQIDLRMLSDAEEWPWTVVHSNPIAKTATGKRNYPLPGNFGTNFLRAADTDGGKRMCKLSDGSGEVFLDYKEPTQLLGNDFVSTSNGRPGRYTVTTVGASKEIFLDPPPDSNSDSHYTIRGAYKMTFRELSLDGFIPEEVVSYLMWSRLMELVPGNQYFQAMFISARQNLYLTVARDIPSQIIPAMGPNAGEDGWTPEYM